MAIDDNTIIQMYFDRDETAISATSEKYGSYCKKIAGNILSSNEDVEECVNDSYLKTWNSIPPSKPDVLRTFIGKITRNTAFDLYRKMSADKRGNGQVAEVLDELAECVSGGNEPEKEYDKKELTEAINAYLGTLSKEKCTIFIRRYWYAERIDAIGKRLGMSEGSVSTALSRLRKDLQKYLTERGFEL